MANISNQFLLISVLCAILFTNGHICPYEYSVDISEGELYENGSVQFEGILYSSLNYDVLRYRIENGQRIETLSYKRGCICQIMQCINVECTIEDEHCKMEKSTEVIEKLLNKSVKDYHPIYNGLGCDYTVELEDDEWSISKNGKVFLIKTAEELEYDQFAFQINEQGNVTLKVCHTEETELKFKVYPIGKCY